MSLETTRDRFVAVDLEATGPNPKLDRVIEFCLIEVDSALREISRFTSLVNPQIAIKPAASKKHGLTQKDVAQFPIFEAFAAEVQRIVSDSILIMHSHTFDLPLLHFELQRAGERGLDATHPCIDTLAIEMLVNSHRLDATYLRYTGMALRNGHRADIDAEATVRVLGAQIRVHGDKLPKSMEKLTYSQLRRASEFGEGKVWLDHSKTIYKDPRGIVRFGFGKHKGRPVKGNEAYAEWILSDISTFPADTKSVLRKALNEKQDQST